MPEMLTAIMVFSVIIGTVCAIYTTSMRTWYLGAAENYAEQKSSLAVQRMVPDLRQGLSVTAASSPYDDVCIAVQLPAKSYDSGAGVYLNQVTSDASGAPYLVQGDYAVYYRGDSNANIAVDGDCVWRRLVRAFDGAVIKQQMLADNVIDNPVDETGNPKPMFIYWPDIYRLRSVEITITVQERMGNRTATKTMNGELSLRNN